MGYVISIWSFTIWICLVILDIDMGYELMIWEMTVSIWQYRYGHPGCRYGISCHSDYLAELAVSNHERVLATGQGPRNDS